jgi:uncharacterized protein (TIGR02391 family)
MSKFPAAPQPTLTKALVEDFLENEWRVRRAVDVVAERPIHGLAIYSIVLDSKRKITIREFGATDSMRWHVSPGLDHRRLPGDATTVEELRDLVDRTARFHGVDPGRPPVTVAVPEATPVAEPIAVRRARVFDEHAFHQTVANECRQLFVEGHFQEAIIRACIAFDNAVRKKANRPEDGDALMGLAFNEATPLLAVNPGQSQNERSERRGVMFLAKGAVAAIRNPNAHELQTHPESYTRECLSLLSMLFRYVDRAP